MANRPGGQLAVQGVDLLLNPSASHFAFRSIGCVAASCWMDRGPLASVYIYANLLGNEAGRAIYDGDAMIASTGELLASGPRFSFRDFHITSAVVDIDALRISRSRAGSYQPITNETQTAVRVSFDYPRQPPDPAQGEPDGWETSPHLKEEEFARAIALGLFDYLRKSRSHGFVVSLSGGADSSAVSTLCALAVHLGLSELGPDALREKLSYLNDWPQTVTQRELVRRLLTCVYQATQNSSATTREAAAAVAGALGATYYELDVDGLVEGYVSLIADAVGRPLSWEQDDLALQNIQARVRGPSVWMLANLAGRPAAGHQQPLGSGRRLRHHGRRHLRRPLAHRRDRQGVSAQLAALDGNRRSGRLAVAARSADRSTSRPPPPNCVPSSRSDRRSRSDALRPAGRHRTVGHP